MDDLSKRLLVLGQYHCYLHFADGHTWIFSQDGYDNPSLKEILERNNIMLNCKIYGGVLEALDTIDECLRLIFSKTLVEQYNEIYEPREIIYIGDGGIAHNRIDKIK